ncbi:MAG: tetratricopeptide (TPR) repeat protein [Patiriisocius sp.]|jgi:tetratricopeptide (TPR) repeat protein
MDELTLELIASYLDGKMAPDERLAFKKKISETPELEKEVLLSKKIHSHFEDPYHQDPIPENKHTQNLRDVLASNEAKSIKDTIKEVGVAYTQLQDSNKKPFRFWMFAAAAILVLFFTVNLFLDTNTGDLYANYYNNQDVPSMIKRDADSTLLTRGVTAFHATNFEEAVILFEQYEVENTIDDTAFYILKGTAYSKIGDITNALVSYDKFIAYQSLDSSKGLWFKALAYLKEGKTKEAKITLSSIGKNDFNFKEAQELIKEL